MGIRNDFYLDLMIQAVYAYSCSINEIISYGYNKLTWKTEKLLSIQ